MGTSWATILRGVMAPETYFSTGGHLLQPQAGGGSQQVTVALVCTSGALVRALAAVPARTRRSVPRAITRSFTGGLLWRSRLLTKREYPVTKVSPRLFFYSLTIFSAASVSAIKTKPRAISKSNQQTHPLQRPIEGGVTKVVEVGPIPLIHFKLLK